MLKNKVSELDFYFNYRFVIVLIKTNYKQK
jgi:hypothetical protein